MELDAQSLTDAQRYKLLTSLIVPRPIALVTTLGAANVVNAAPFSFFNVVGSDPPVVVLGIGDRPEGGPKDTAANIRQNRQFVVNLVSESIAPQMNVCAVDFPAGISELSAAGLTPAPSVKVSPPRIAESPVNLECEELQTLLIGENRIILGQIVHFSIRDDLVDASTLRIHTDAMKAVGRMHAPGWYARMSDLFELSRESYPQWQKRQTNGG